MLDPEQWLEIPALAAYLLLLLWIGLRNARQIQTTEDFVLAGRGVPWVILLATTAATMVGGGASVGSVRKVYEFGIAAAFVTCAWHLQLILVGLWIAPRLRALSLITVADFIGYRFGPLARLLATLSSLLFLTGALAAQLVAMGRITETFLGIDYGWALLVGAALTTFYSTIGGIRAVVSTDVLQFIVLVGGIGVAAALLFQQQGGFQGFLASPHLELSAFQLTGHWSGLKLISVFVAFLLGETFTPPYAMRCFIAVDSRHARWGVTGAGLFLLLFLPICTLVIGYAAVVHFPGIQPELAFPTLIRSTFTPLFSGVMIAALVAAVMSSGDSCLSCGSTVVMQDFYRHYFRPWAADRELLRVARVTTVLGGAIATLWAYHYPVVIDALEFVYDFWAPIMIVPFLVGTLWYRSTRIYAVVGSMMAGLLSVMIWLTLGSPGEVGAALLGLIVGIPCFLLLVPLTRSWPLVQWATPEETE